MRERERVRVRVRERESEREVKYLTKTSLGVEGMENQCNLI